MHLLPLLLVLGGASGAATIVLDARLKNTLLSPVFAVAAAFAIGATYLLAIGGTGLFDRKDTGQAGRPNTMVGLARRRSCGYRSRDRHPRQK